MGLKKNIIAFLVIGTIGTLSHFIFEWTNENYLAGLIFPVNESVWEHLKLLFYPTIIYSLFEYNLSEEKSDNYLQAVVFSLICGMFWITALFYIYTGVLGQNIDFLNISIYFIGVIISLSKKNKIITEEKYTQKLYRKIAIISGVVFIILFTLMSYNPLSIGIFTPPAV